MDRPDFILYPTTLAQYQTCLAVIRGQTEHEMVELRSEIARHHRDFVRISELIHDIIETYPAGSYPEFEIKQIRDIVG